MPTLYLTEERALVRRDSKDCLLVQIPERRESGGDVLTAARKEYIPLVKIDDVVVMGEVTLTASALHLLLENNLEVTFLGHYGQFKGRLSPPFSKNALLRQAQYRAHQNMEQRCRLARQFAIGKLTNQRTRLLRHQRSSPGANAGLTSQAIEQIASVLQQLNTVSFENVKTTVPLASGDNRVEGTPLETILGLEGAGSAAYFRCFGDLLTDPQLWPFAQRVKRPPTDAINSLLSFSYSLLNKQVANAVQLVGFDHFVGYLHSSVYGRPALALDLMEEFRPLIADSVALSLLNKRMLTPNDFIVELGAYRIKQERRGIFFTQFEERLNEEITHPIFGYKATYRRCIELQARLLAKYLIGEIDEYPPLLIR